MDNLESVQIYDLRILRAKLALLKLIMKDLFKRQVHAILPLTLPIIKEDFDVQVLDFNTQALADRDMGAEVADKSCVLQTYKKEEEWLKKKENSSH